MLSPKFHIIKKSLSEQLNLTKKYVCSHIFNSNFENDPFGALILKNTVVSRNHLTPELKMRLITGECELWNCRDTESPFPSDPFWGIYWPGGQGLGRYILDNRELFHQKNVLDIGSGSGACALAAAKSGAAVVLANDTDPVSISAIHINSKLNNLKVHTYGKNLVEKDIDSLVIKSDTEISQLEWNVILLGRHTLKEVESLKGLGSVLKVSEYDLCDKDHNGFSSTSVYRIEPS